MSAIGDYVHRSWAGYVRSGIEQNGSSPKQGWKTYENIRSDIRQRAASLTTLTKEEAEILEDSLNSLKQNIAKEDSSYRKMIQNHMQKTFGDALGKINWDTLDVTVANPQWYVGKSGLEKDQEKILDINYMQKKLDQLNNAIVAQMQSGKLTSTEGKKIKEECEELKTQYENSIKMLSSELKKKMPTSLSDVSNTSIKNNLSEIRKTFLTLVRSYAAWPNINLQKGELFEFVVGILGVDVSAMAMNEIDQVLKGLTQREDIIYDFAAFHQGSIQAALNVNNKTMVKNGTQCVVKSNAAQGKVDIEFTWKEKKVSASVKNYKLNNSYAFIHVLSGSPLAYMLQTEDANNRDFINHYLNLWSQHEEHRIPSSANLANKKKESVEGMKLLLFYKALTGDGLLGRAPANVFILNERSSNTAKVFTMQMIIDKINKNNMSALSVHANDQDLKKIKFNNPINADSADARINALIADLHATKISAGFSPKGLGII